MKIKKWVLIILPAITLISCNHRNTNTPFDTLLLTSIPNQPCVSYSTVFDSINCVFLETSDSSLLMQIRNVLLIKDRFVIHDRTLNKVVIFNTKGKFVARIQAKKKGFPMEIQSIAKFGDDQIIILDNRAMQIGFYSLDGVLRKKVPITTKPVGLFSFDKCIGLYRSFIKTGKDYLVQLTDTTGNDISSFLLKDKNNIVKHDLHKPLQFFTSYRRKDSTFLFSADYNTLYIIDKDQIRIKEKILRTLTNTDSTSFKIINFIESERFLFIDAIINKRLYNYVYDHNENHLSLLQNINNSAVHVYGFQNTDLFGYPVWPGLKLNDSLLCQVVDITAAKKFIQSASSTNISDSSETNTLKQCIINKGPIDNPLLILLSVKSN